jgi:CHAT domain-containing protein
VKSAATVKLITGAMKRLAANRAMGRAEAMRQSMLDLIDHGKPYESHPAYWAPFAVVGEGGAAKSPLGQKRRSRAATRYAISGRLLE